MTPRQNGPVTLRRNILAIPCCSQPFCFSPAPRQSSTSGTCDRAVSFSPSQLFSSPLSGSSSSPPLNIPNLIPIMKTYHLIAASVVMFVIAGSAQIAVVSEKRPAPLTPSSGADRAATETIDRALVEEKKQPNVALGAF